MEGGGRLGKLVIFAALAYGSWWVYDRYYTPPGIVEEADRAMLAGRYRDAADLYEEALWDDADNPRLHLKLGECYFYLGQRGLAASHYRRCESLLKGGNKSVDMRRHEERYNTLVAQGF